MMTSEEYILLYEKYLSGYCTTEEINELIEHRDRFKMVDTDGKLLAEERQIKNRVYQRINKTLFVKPAKIINFRFWGIAACLLIGVSISALFLKQEPEKVVVANIKVKPIIIKPGRNTAILTLADGTNIQLDEAKTGLLATAGKTAIKKLVNGEIVYDASANTNAGAAVSMNTISIPRGGQYPLTLSDGTKVWLNSVSSLTYPTSFNGNERVVELEGEAYFEVAPNANMPFKVKTNKVNVEVLGTHFNIKAYNDEASIKTTLLEGSVLLSNKNSTVKLVPGEQGTANSTSAIDVKNVKVTEVIAWKNGSFVFRHANIQEIMKQISRWYDVDVEYRGNVSEEYFGGTYSKYKDIKELLHGLELTERIHFKIEGRRIIAMP